MIVSQQEFAFTQTSWRYSPYVTRTQTDDDRKSHGSCVGSIVVGTTYGLSKGTPLIVMKSTLEESDVLWAFANIADEMYSRGGSRQKSVILFAYGSIAAFDPQRPFTTLQPWDSIRKIMRSIIDLDGIIVVPSGNSREGSVREESDVLPALFTRLR